MTSFAEPNRKLTITDVINNFLVGRRQCCEFCKIIDKSSLWTRPRCGSSLCHTAGPPPNAWMHTLSHSINFGTLFPSGLCMPLSATVCATCSARHAIQRIFIGLCSKYVLLSTTRLTHLIPARTSKLTPADQGHMS